MRQDTITLTLTPDILTIMQKVPVQEVERALRKAFPEALEDPDKAEMTEQEQIEDNLRFLEEFFSAPMPKPKGDIDEQLRALRDERHEI